MQKPNIALKLAIIDSSDTWYAQPRQIYDELCQIGIDCLWMARPNHEGFRKNRVPEGYTTVCIANNLGPIDFNTRQPLTLAHPPLERAYRSGADFIFIGDRTTFKRYFSDRPNAFYMPYAVNSGTYKPLDHLKEIYDVGFVGNVKLGERARRLSLLHKHFRSFVGNNLFMEKANEAMNRCKIIFNTSDHREINMRVFEALATGKLVVTDRVDYLDELFEDGEHLVTYSDEEQMVEKISYYLKHEDERREIARRGLEEVRRAHTYRHRACFIAEKVIQERFTSSQVMRDHARSTRSYRMFYEEQSKVNTLAQERIFDFSIPDPEGDPTKYNIRERLKEAILVARGRVLDVGCQRGGYCFNLKKAGLDVVGIDISLNYLTTARAKLPGTPLVQADAQLLPFASERFDTVLLSEILEHVIDDVQVVAEAKRILKEGGLVFVTVPAYVEESEEHVRFLSRRRLAVLFEDFNIEFVENPRVKSTLMIARKKDARASSESASTKLAGPAEKPSSVAPGESTKMNSRELRSILLATNHLFAFTGSEITLYTIAKFLKEKGHSVTVFAKYVDPSFTGAFHGIASVYTDLQRIRHHRYDAAYVQHHTTALEVCHHFPDLPIVLASLGVLPFLEQPPIADLNISRYLAISEEVKANLVKKGIDDDAVTIFRNIVDSGKFRPLREIAETPRSAIIYSYKIDDGKLATILKACGVLGIRCRRIGEKPGVLHQDDVAAQINEADIVFTLGRGAIETMMCGKIPIIYDYQGGDGMVTPENIHELMRCNFSGRLHGISYTVQQLIDEIKKYKRKNGIMLRNLATELFDANRNVDTLIRILQEARDAFSKNAQKVQANIIRDVVEIINTTRKFTEDTLTKRQPAPLNRNITSQKGIKISPSDQGAAQIETEMLKTRLIAFYLPQYHPIPENDTWWGKGFTEWNSVAKARPCFPDHYQPHIPADLGFYDLRLPEARKAQADLAREHGIYGFCYYHYWFNGKLLLERPLQDVLESGEPNFPFCLCWANENWTRAWDGQNSDILIKQNYGSEDDLKHIRHLCGIFQDRRYIRIGGKPLFIVYRASHFPDPLRTTSLWREEARKVGIGELFLCRVERFVEDMSDPQALGFDAAIEFQPDGIHLGKPLDDPKYKGHHVYEYDALVRAALSKKDPKYLRFPCVCPSWDNSPRRQKNAVIFSHSNPQLYEEWLKEIIARTAKSQPEERIVFINAFNEWGEGCHLEPDEKFGRAYLEATQRVLLSCDDESRRNHPLNVSQEFNTSNMRSTRRRDDIKTCSDRLPRVSIVIPVFNKVDFTRKCLAALSRNTPRGLYECIIVDNASIDGTGEYLKSLGDEIKVITNQSNLGFAKACNQGARAAAASYILFLNNDTEPQPGWLEPLVEILDRDASAAAVGSKMLFPDGTIQHAGVLILDDRKLPDPLVARHIYYNQPSDFREANESRLYQALTAACLLIRRGAFEAVGGFDEGYWNGYEDIDFCFKLQEKGWRLVYQPRSVLIHHESKSGPERFTKVRENIIRLHSRWLGRIKPDAVIEKDGSFRWTDARRIQIYKIPKGKAIEEPSKGQADLTSIVILSFNELGYTKRCVESIRKNTPEPHEIIFVDNDSKDGTVKWLRRMVEENPSYKLIENEENLGFARGCNQGIEASKGEYILLLNNDVLVTDNWLPGMLEHLKSSPDIGIVGPMTNNISGIQKVEGTIYKSLDDLETYAREFRNRNRHRRVASRRLVGFCMLFRQSLVKEIGLLDESFGTGNFEDDDFCLRAALAGYRNVIAGDVFIHHFGSRSFIGNRINYGTSLTGNRKIFDDKWRGIQLDEGQGRRCLVLKNVEEARKQYQLGRLNKAVDLCLEAIKCVSSETKIYHGLAEILIQTKNFKEALDVLREIPPERQSEKTWILTGFAKEGLNEDDAALTLAERTLEHPETRAEALNLKGILAYKKASLEEAASFFLQAIEVDPSYGEAHTNLGVVRWKEEAEADALRFLEKGFILSPDLADVANLYHAASKSIGQFSRAEAIFREAKGLYPFNRSISFLLIDLLIGQEKFAEAMEEIERAMTLFKVDEGFLQAALDVRKKVGPLEPAQEIKSDTISLCMIVKNEEKNLIRCLSTIKGVVDEIIVVDTGSTDRTKDIAAAFGAKVFEIPWRDDFSEARNLSLAKATCDWILIMDADEALATGDFKKLRRLTAQGKDKKDSPDGFVLTTRNYSSAMNTAGWTPNDGYYTDEEAGPGWYPSPKIRLFRNDRRIRFEGAVHELVEDSMARHHLKIFAFDLPVHHYGTLKVEDSGDKGKAYYELGKKKIDESGGNARAIYELAIQAARLRRYDEAVDLWNQFLNSGSTEDLHLAYMNLGHVCLETGRYAEAAEACKKALEIDPELKEAHLNLAMSDFYMGRLSDASAILEKLIAKIPDYIPARALLAAALILTGETDRYKATVDPMRKKGMDPAVFFQSYAEKLLSTGHEEDSERLFKAARIIWRDLLKSRGLKASDEEIERVMVIAAGESNPQKAVLTK